MPDDNPSTRRTVLGTVAAILGALFGVTAGAASVTRTDSDTTTEQRAAPTEHTIVQETHELNAQPRNGIYDGTIDRIVDGEAAVLLLESGGETVGQEVLDRDRIPGGEEGDSVTVWLVRGIVISVWID